MVQTCQEQGSYLTSLREIAWRPDNNQGISKSGSRERQKAENEQSLSSCQSRTGPYQLQRTLDYERLNLDMVESKSS